MSIKLYLQIVIFGTFAYDAHAGIMMSRSKKFEFLCDNSYVFKKEKFIEQYKVSPLDYCKKYGMAHYLVVRLGMQNNLPQLVIDKIVEHARHIPEAKKSIKYFKCYDKFESLSLFPDLYAVLNSDSCFRSKFAHFFNTYSVPGEKKQQEIRWDFDINFNNEDRFPYEEWLALGCMQKFELSLATLDDLEDDIAFLKEENAIITTSQRFGSSCCVSLQEQAIDMGSGVVETVDTQTLSLKRTFRHDRPLPFMRVIYNPDGTELVAQAKDGIITVWDVKTGKCTHTIAASPLLACFYHNQGKEFVYSPDGIHWRVIKWALFKKFERNDYPIEKCNMLETLLNKKIEAVKNKTDYKDLDNDIKCLVITDKNNDSDASSEENESE